ncbi:Transmembrane and coiled-coil domain-containing protein 4 [Coemansia erecta]|uniref:Transmembrane and coiled-coil domain-containing protein 4 n=1 Tax=Coemansia erecta TaxID=147472 RepID=A0A9W7Y7T4_9FUNG|nr:Transmembrane and coiled-coil domain-containing protein 4 [Coemansia erecta]
MPYGEAANDMLLLMLRCMRADEEIAEKDKSKTSASLQISGDPESLYSGLLLTCIGLCEQDIQDLDIEDQGKDSSHLRPLEYDSRSRAAAFVIGDWLEMPPQFVGVYEARIASGLEHAADRSRLGDAGARALDQEKQRKWGWRKYLATGAGVAVAGTLVGVTAGLAAPLMVAGMGAVGIGGLGFLATSGGAAMVGSLLGAAGGGVIGKRFNTRLRGLREFYFTQLPLALNPGEPRSHCLHATMFVPGFLEAAAATSPFAPVRGVMGLDLGDAYTLYFETRELAALQTAFADFVRSSAKSAAVTAVLAQTVLGGLLGAFTWPLAILKLGQLIDSPWSVGIERAKRAGKMLAEVLESRAHGARPVTLVGYSLGALVIFTCLQELHRRKAYGIVETAVLLGMPVDSTDIESWNACCQCVSRRIVVGFSKSDWVLAFLFRASSFCASLSGLSGVDTSRVFAAKPLARRKVVNLDLSDVVSQHNDYLDKLDDVMLEVSRLL